MKRIKQCLIAVLLLVVALVVVSQFLPSSYHVERSVLVAAKPVAIYPWVAVLKKWPEWSPWTTAKDPTLVYRYEGPEEGVGAVSRWDSKKMGDGMMRLIQAESTKGVAFDLAFEKGKYLSVGRIAFEPSGDATRVVWSMDGKAGSNPVDRLFGLVMDRMVGPDFEEGLGKLKLKVEAK